MFHRKKPNCAETAVPGKPNSRWKKPSPERQAILNARARIYYATVVKQRNLLTRGEPFDDAKELYERTKQLRAAQAQEYENEELAKLIREQAKDDKAVRIQWHASLDAIMFVSKGGRQVSLIDFIDDEGNLWV